MWCDWLKPHSQIQHCYYKFYYKENSSLIFNYNSVKHGGAIGCEHHSAVPAEGNSNVMFTKNKATAYDGEVF